MKCLDCPNAVPLHWKRCEECAMGYLRFLMSDGAVPYVPGGLRHFVKGERVVLRDGRVGVVKRRQRDKYTVDIIGGKRLDVFVGDLRPEIRAKPA